MDAWRPAPGVESEPALGQVPAVERELGLAAGARAEREDTRHEWQLTDRDPVHEVLAPAVEGILDLEHVVPVVRDLVGENGVRPVAEIVVVGQLLA